MIGGQIRHPRHLFPPLKESKGSSSQQTDLRAGFMKHNLPKCNKFFFLEMLSRRYSAGRKIIEVVISAVPHPTLTPVALKAFPSTAFAINFFLRVDCILYFGCIFIFCICISLFCICCILYSFVMYFVFERLS